MHKIMTIGVAGTFQWTPPASLQQKLDSAPPEVSDAMKKWAGQMIDGYLCALLDSQRTVEGIQRIEAKTMELAMEILVGSKPAPPSQTAPPATHLN